MLAFLTLVLAGVYGVIAYLMYLSLNETRRSTRAAETAAGAAANNLELSHRAHLSIDRVNFSYLGANATLVIRKSGFMPATRLNFHYRRGIYPTPVQVDPSTFNIPMLPPFVGQIVSHNEPVALPEHVVSTEAFDEAQRAEVRRPDGTFQEVILVGYMLAYFDGFRERHTWQAFAYNPDTRQFASFAGDQE